MLGLTLRVMCFMYWEQYIWIGKTSGTGSQRLFIGGQDLPNPLWWKYDLVFAVYTPLMKPVACDSDEMLSERKINSVSRTIWNDGRWCRGWVIRARLSVVVGQWYGEASRGSEKLKCDQEANWRLCCVWNLKWSRFFHGCGPLQENSAVRSTMMDMSLYLWYKWFVIMWIDDKWMPPLVWFGCWVMWGVILVCLVSTRRVFL